MNTQTQIHNVDQSKNETRFHVARKDNDNKYPENANLSHIVEQVEIETTDKNKHNQHNLKREVDTQKGYEDMHTTTHAAAAPQPMPEHWERGSAQSQSGRGVEHTDVQGHGRGASRTERSGGHKLSSRAQPRRSQAAHSMVKP